MEKINIDQIMEACSGIYKLDDERKEGFKKFLKFHVTEKYLEKTGILERIDKKGVPNEVVLPGGEDTLELFEQLAKVYRAYGISIAWHPDLVNFPIFSWKMNISNPSFLTLTNDDRIAENPQKMLNDALTHTGKTGKVNSIKKYLEGSES